MTIEIINPIQPNHLYGRKTILSKSNASDGLLKAPLGAGAWTWKQRRFQEWIAVPAKHRPDHLKNDEAFAKEFNVGKSRLNQWKMIPGFWDETYRYAKSIVGDSMGQILESMVNEATMGSVQAAKLCLQILEVFHEKVDVNNTYEEPLEIMLVVPQDGGNHSRL